MAFQRIRKHLRSLGDRIVPFPYSHGLYFRKFYRMLLESQYWPREKMVEFQNMELRKLIAHCYENVPYYRRIMDERGLTSQDIRSMDDLKKLPLLTKDIVRREEKNLRARNFKVFKPKSSHTSGSTGEPVYYCIDQKLTYKIHAIVSRHWAWTDFIQGNKIAIFRGTLIDEFGSKKEAIYHREGNLLHFSTFRMNAENVAKFIEVMNREKPKMVRGYPSSLFIVARHILEHRGLEYQPLTLQTSSEVLTDEQRKVIETAFGTKIFDWYSHGESTIAAGDCEYHDGFHLNMEFGITEFLDLEKHPEAKNLVATSLWNYSMPFIRYDTEDLAVVGSKPCGCGRTLPILERIVGRKADIIHGVNGASISPSAFLHFWKYKVTKKLKRIKYTQIVQHTPSRLELRVVMPSNREYENFIRSAIMSLLGDMSIELTYLDVVPSGDKWRFTICRI